MADLSVTAANVRRGSGQTQQGIVASGVTITAGQSVYQLADGTYGLADSDGTSPANVFAGISINGAAAGQPFLFVASDPTFTPGFTALAGDPIYMSDTPGGLTKTFADLESGDKVTVVGVMTSTTVMNLSPVTGGTI
jgi:hypothetical protein